MTFLRTLAMLAATAATLFLIVACGGGGGGATPPPGPGVPPQPGQALQVVATTPAGGSAYADLDTVIEVAFSAALDDTQFPNPPLIVRVDGIVVPGTIESDPGLGMLTFTPTNPLPHRAQVEVTARAGIMDVDGNEMTDDVAVGFMTRLPRFGDEQPTLAPGTIGNARVFKQNAAGQGAIVHTNRDFNSNATVYVTRLDANGTVLGTDAIGSGAKATTNARLFDIADNGDILAPWRYDGGGDNDISVRIYDASAGTWGNLLSLDFNPATTVLQMEGAIAPNGDAIVAWTTAPTGTNQASHMYVRCWDADGGWTGTFFVEAGTGEVRHPRVAMGAGGDAVLVWGEVHTDGERVHALRWSGANGFTSRETIDAQAPGNARPDDVVVDANGRIVVIYSEERAPSEWTMWAARYEPTGMAPGWQAPERLDDTYGTAVGLGQAVVDAVGRVTLAWGAQHGTALQLLARQYTPLGGWSALKTFAHERVWFQHGIALDVGPDGTVGVVVQERANNERHVFAAVWAPDPGAWSTLAPIATTPYDHFRPVTARAWRDGHLFAAWSTSDGDPATESAHHAGRWIGPDGAQHPVVVLNPETNESSQLAGIGIDAQGRGAAVWTDLLDVATDDYVLRHRWID